MRDFSCGLPMPDRIFRHAELMDRVMERLGIDPSVAARLDRGTGWYEARTRCLACRDERQCRLWLEQTDPVPAAPPRPCATAEFFRRCRASRPNTGPCISVATRIDGGAP